MDQLDPSEVKSRKQVGTCDGDPVYELRTKGGLVLEVCKRKSGKVDTLALSSHRAIARFIMEKRHNVKITELQKSDHFPYESFAHLVPKWEAVTDQVVAREAQRRAK